MYAARGALPPLAPHFYPLSALRATSPEGGSEAYFYRLCEGAKRRSKLPGGWVSAKYIIFTLVVGYFACAQYDVCFFCLSLRGSEATAAIPWSKVRGMCCVFFQGDRHANARDDTGNLPCYGFCKVLTQIYCADFGFLPRFTVLLGICAINSSWRFIYAAIFALIIYCGGALTSGSFKTDSPVALFFRSVCSSGRVLEKSFFPLDAELNLSIRSKSPNFSTV